MAPPARRAGLGEGERGVDGAGVRAGGRGVAPCGVGAAPPRRTVREGCRGGEDRRGRKGERERGGRGRSEPAPPAPALRTAEQRDELLPVLLPGAREDDPPPAAPAVVAPLGRGAGRGCGGAGGVGVGDAWGERRGVQVRGRWGVELQKGLLMGFG